MNLLYFLLTHSSHLIITQTLKFLINTIALSLIKSCECMQEGNKVMFLVKDGMKLLYFLLTHSSHLITLNKYNCTVTD